MAPESRTSNFANLSCILAPELSGTRMHDIRRVSRTYTKT